MMLETGSHMEGNSKPPLRNTEARERKKTRRRRRRKTAGGPTKSGHSTGHIKEDKGQERRWHLKIFGSYILLRRMFENRSDEHAIVT